MCGEQGVIRKCVTLVTAVKVQLYKLVVDSIKLLLLDAPQTTVRLAAESADSSGKAD